MTPAAFQYHAPASVDEVVHLLSELGEDARLLAGGQSLLPAMKLRLAAPEHVLDLRKLRGDLGQLREEPGQLALGALATHDAVATSPETIRAAPLLAETATHVGDLQVRNFGTIGGSLAHADPAADPPAAVLASEAVLVATGPAGKRRIAAADFFLGLFETALEPGEMLIEILVPQPEPGEGFSYQKFAHPASGYAVCGVAVAITRNEDRVAGCRVAVTGVADGPYRATFVEEAMLGRTFDDAQVERAARFAADGVDALEDLYADAAYRRQLARVLTQRALSSAWQRCRGD